VWATVGSANLDWRSFLHNDELNVVVLGREFAAAMERLFSADREKAIEVDAAEWQRRGVGQRIMEFFGKAWQYWL
jgi:cardiolipin synthase